jgi:L-lactate dehydrogenase complex protein LldG
VIVIIAVDTVQEFRRSLSRSDVTSELVSVKRFEEALADTVEQPAVGSSLPFPDLSLSECPVELDPGLDSLREATTGVTGSRLGVASLGTIVVESRPQGDELVSLLPEYHVVVVQTSDVRKDLESAFSWLADEFDAGRDSLVLATGPSATGDMGALVQGVHGPERVHVIIVDNE